MMPTIRMVASGGRRHWYFASSHAHRQLDRHPHTSLPISVRTISDKGRVHDYWPLVIARVSRPLYIKCQCCSDNPLHWHYTYLPRYQLWNQTWKKNSRSWHLHHYLAPVLLQRPPLPHPQSAHKMNAAIATPIKLPISVSSLPTP